MGFSIGSSYGSKYLSRNGEKIKGMVCISNPFNVFEATLNLDNFKNIIYGKYMTKLLIDKAFFNKESLFKFIKHNNIKDFCFEKLKNSKNIFDFHHNFTFSLFERNHKDIEKIYENLNCDKDIKYIDKPVLFIQSKNDPISKIEFFPKNIIKSKDNLIGVITPRGAHVEYFVGVNTKRWYADVVSDYLLLLNGDNCF